VIFNRSVSKWSYWRWRSNRNPPAHNTHLASLPFDFHIFGPFIGHYTCSSFCSVDFISRLQNFIWKELNVLVCYSTSSTSGKIFGWVSIEAPWQTHRLMHLTVICFSSVLNNLRSCPVWSNLSVTHVSRTLIYLVLLGGRATGCCWRFGTGRRWRNRNTWRVACGVSIQFMSFITFLAWSM